MADIPDQTGDFWQVAQILYDPEGAAARLPDQAAELWADGKPRMADAHPASVVALGVGRPARRGRPGGRRLVLYERVIELTATFFDVREQWTPPTKRRPARIAELDPGLHRLLTAIYADGATFQDQLTLARRMVPLVYDEPRA